jgi:hypothetical protein
MATVKIYKIFCNQSFGALKSDVWYSLEPWNKNTIDYDGSDDGGQDYIIPDGFTVAEGNDKQLHFYDSNDRYCELISQFGKPAICIGMGTIILKSAAAASLGRKGGVVKSDVKANTARENGKKGGRPKKAK